MEGGVWGEWINGKSFVCVVVVVLYLFFLASVFKLRIAGGNGFIKEIRKKCELVLLLPNM